MIAELRKRARALKSQTLALYYAYRDPRTPWYAKVWAALVVAYAFSPIDLIPDFIPVLGYLDDLLLVPLGITLAIKMIPAEVMADSQAKAETRIHLDLPGAKIAAALIIAVWIIMLGWLTWSGYRWIAALTGS